MAHFPSYAPHSDMSKPAINIGIALLGALASAPAVMLIDVVGYALGVKRLDILLVNGRWSSFPDALVFREQWLPIPSPFGLSRPRWFASY